MKGKKRKSRKTRVFDAQRGKVLKILVKVRKEPDGEYQVITEDPKVHVKGGLVFIVWELSEESATTWKFQKYGISVDDDDNGQFIYPHRFNAGREFALVNKNTKDGEYKYTVSLQRRRKPLEVIWEDPIIENEGDGRP